MIIKVKASSFECSIVCLSKMYLNKATRLISELLEHPSFVTELIQNTQLLDRGLMQSAILSFIYYCFRTHTVNN